MRITLDKKYLQDITKGNHDLLISEEQEHEMERIRGMLTQNIRFCSLVTGYRGTGKSSFIKYILNKFQEENKDILVVSFNAAKYQNYTIFIRRFVRELFFQMDRKGFVSEQLRKMYFHTFFDIRETYMNNFYKSQVENSEKENEEKVQFKTNVNILKLIANVIKIGIYLVTIIAIWNNADTIWIKLIGSFIWLILVLLCEIMELNLSWEIIFKNRKSKKNEEQKKREHSKLAETLYDNEIAEYYVYDELQKIDEKKKNLVFVLDELDKVDDEELDMIFHDLKPLFLSGNCNFILIAGRNMEKYLYASKNDTDSITTTIFTHRIYIPLSTIQDMREFAVCFYMPKDIKRREKEFYADDNVQKYFNLKIYEAKGVKRAFVNGVISDLRWENGEPYVDLLSKNINKDFLVLFNVLEKMEEVICQEYTGPKRDELLQNLYCWIEKIKQNQHTVFSEKDIVGEEGSIIRNSVYSNVAEQMNLIRTLLEQMIENHILEQKDNYYKWRSEIMVKQENNGKEDIEQNNRMEEYVEMFQKQWNEIGNILFCFAKYNGLIYTSYGIIYNEPDMYRSLLEEMIPDFRTNNSEIKNSLSYLCKLYEHGIENDDIKDIQNYSRRISATKAHLVEDLMRFTIEKSLCSVEKAKFYKERLEKMEYDIVYYDGMSNKTIFIEIKFYKEYMKLINSSLLYKMFGRISNYANINKIERYMLKLIVFTDLSNEVDMGRFQSKCRKMLEEFYVKDKLQIVLVPFNDYEMFKMQLDLLRV